MSAITIIESDEFARGVLAGVLADRGLDAYCRVTGAPQKGDGGVCLLIKNRHDPLPPGLKIMKGDQFIKPLRLGALLDRIDGHIRAAGRSEEPSILTIGPYSLDIQNTLLTGQDGKTIRLTDKETQILQYLAQNEDEGVERSALLSAVWGYAENIETHTLETHMYRLRQKIEKDPANPALLVTTDKGYRLNI